MRPETELGKVRGWHAKLAGGPPSTLIILLDTLQMSPSIIRVKYIGE